MSRPANLFVSYAAVQIPAEFATAFGRAFAVFIKELSNRTTMTKETLAMADSLAGTAIREAILVRSRRATEEELRESPDCTEVTEDDMAKKLAASIAAAVRNTGTSQKEIAARLKVNPSVVSRILQKPENSSIDKLCKVAKAAGVIIEPGKLQTAAA